MPKSEKLYEVTQTWEHEETRMVEAKSPKEAAEKARDGRYIDVLGWNLVGFIGTESVKEVKRANYKLNNGKLTYPREPRKIPKHR